MAARARPRITTLVVPVTLPVFDALLAGDDEFTSRYGMPVAPGYLDVPAVLGGMRDAVAAGTPPEWWSHLVVHRETTTVVGLGGYKGAPVAGEVEIGYSIAPAHRRRGHATAAVDAFVTRAARGGVRLVVAHTRPEESPSTRILGRAGFSMVETVREADLGDLWRFELPIRGR